MLVSNDVTALFTHVPLDEAINILVNQVFTDYYWFNKPMCFTGKKIKKMSSLSYLKLPQSINFSSSIATSTNKEWLWAPLLATLCLLEEKLTCDCLMPHLYRRYVDDTLARMPNTDAATMFLSTTLNGLHPSLTSRWTDCLLMTGSLSSALKSSRMEQNSKLKSINIGSLGRLFVKVTILHRLCSVFHNRGF